MDFGCDDARVVELAICRRLKSHGFGCDATRVVEP
jgi:hypothetical protein